MVNLTDMLREIIAMADKPDRDINKPLLISKIFALEACINDGLEPDAEFFATMPIEMRQAAVSLMLATLLATVQGYDK